MEQVILRGFLEGKFTRQQYFDFVCTKLLEQGAPCVDENGDCVYNGPNGMHCGIGWTTIGEQVLETESVRGMLTGELDNHDEEADDGWLFCPDVDGAVYREVGFLTRLQQAHDRTTSSLHNYGDFETSFVIFAKRLADEFQLDASVLADGARE